ncbi:uncharacterized protein EDB91DRAFT_1085078 [Suillus paluster]|uniref:uncharacterized protein n=1 Tax=Suillus paluster TaxID=48578 RepID=UPI001B87910C|nr:uncharacterized protein EDB91DRAFT_1085078 [Suillus paluster]KAG1731319.1 hypothetical protein EDB91DRAFT_1085078 [Suillus paluster]
MTTTTNNDQSSLDAVLQLLSLLTLSNDEVQTLIQVISDGSGGPPAMSSAAIVTPTAAVITPVIVTPSATFAVPAVAIVSPPPAVAINSPPSAVAVVSPPAVASETQAAAFVQTVPAPTMHSGFFGFPHLPMTAIVVNGEMRGQQQYCDFSFDVPSAGALGPFYLVTCGCQTNPDSALWMTHIADSIEHSRLLNVQHSMFKTQTQPFGQHTLQIRRWLKNQLGQYNYCYEYKYEDLIEFWTSLYEIFFDCWPERCVRWGDKKLISSPIMRMGIESDENNVRLGSSATDWADHRPTLMWSSSTGKWSLSEEQHHQSWFQSQTALMGYILFTIMSVHNQSVMLQAEEGFTEDWMDVTGDKPASGDVEDGGSTNTEAQGDGVDLDFD